VRVGLEVLLNQAFEETTLFVIFTDLFTVLINLEEGEGITTMQCVGDHM